VAVLAACAAKQRPEPEVRDCLDGAAIRQIAVRWQAHPGRGMVPLDLKLRSLVYDVQKAAAELERAGSALECIHPTVEVGIDFRGEVADLEAAGLQLAFHNQHPDGIKMAVGTIPLARLLDLGAVEHVLRVSGPSRLFPDEKTTSFD